MAKHSNILTLKALFSTFLIQVAASASMVALATVAPLAAADLHVPASMIGTYLAILYIGAAISSVSGGNLVRRYGGIHVSQAALVLAAVGLMLGCAPVIALVAVAAFLVGLGYGPVTPASSDILAHCVPRERMGVVFSLKQTGVPAGGALGGLIVPGLAAHFGWVSGITAIAIICVTLAGLSLFVRRELDDHYDPKAAFSLDSVRRSLRLVLGTPALRRLAAVSFVYNGMQMCVLGFLVSYLVEDKGFALVFAGLALSCANAGGICGRIFWGWFADAVHSPRLVLSGLGFLMAAASVALTFSGPSWGTGLLIACCVVLGGTSIGWNGVYLAHVARSAPEGLAGVATGGTLFFTFVGAMLLPAIFGFVERLTGSYSVSFWMMAAICLSICLWLLLSHDAPARA